MGTPLDPTGRRPPKREGTRGRKWLGSYPCGCIISGARERKSRKSHGTHENGSWVAKDVRRLKDRSGITMEKLSLKGVSTRHETSAKREGPEIEFKNNKTDAMGKKSRHKTKIRIMVLRCHSRTKTKEERISRRNRKWGGLWTKRRMRELSTREKGVEPFWANKLIAPWRRDDALSSNEMRSHRKRRKRERPIGDLQKVWPLRKAEQVAEAMDLKVPRGREGQGDSERKSLGKRRLSLAANCEVKSSESVRGTPKRYISLKGLLGGRTR